MYPLMKILPLMATTPFFTPSEILVEGIGMQEEELHSGVNHVISRCGNGGSINTPYSGTELLGIRMLQR